MEAVEDIVIVGAGIAGLATALGLHRLGLRSLVLESSDGLRTTGYFSTTWANAWMRPGSANHSAHSKTNFLVAHTLFKELLRHKQVTSSEVEYKRIEMGLQNYAKERRWRVFEHISTSYMVGYIQQSNGKVLNFLRDRALVAFLARQLLKMAEYKYNCGKLSAS